MAILLVAEHNNRALSGATAKALTAAKALGGPVHVLVAGSNAAGVAEKAAALSGVDKVLLADAEHLKAQLAEDLAALVVPLMDGYDALVVVASTTGKNFAPRVAALLDVAQLSDVTAVLSPTQFERPIYAGNAIQTVECSQGKKVLTIRTRPSPPRLKAARLQSSRSQRPRRMASLNLSAKSCLNRNGQNSPRPRSSFPAAAACSPARTSSSWNGSPTS